MNQIFLNNFSHPVMIVVPAGDGVGVQLLGVFLQHPLAERLQRGYCYG